MTYRVAYCKVYREVNHIAYRITHPIKCGLTTHVSVTCTKACVPYLCAALYFCILWLLGDIFCSHKENFDTVSSDSIHNICDNLETIADAYNLANECEQISLKNYRKVSLKYYLKS
uniref:Uncharacterized protein n=1 Tax=Glossina brevipalpis TaxID=37001 RepID=A0A1A9W3W1_9MUSC